MPDRSQKLDCDRKKFGRGALGTDGNTSNAMGSQLKKLEKADCQ